MVKRSLYLLCRLRNDTDEKQNMGLFSSVSKALIFLKCFPKSHPYCVYKIPANAPLCVPHKFKDIQQKYAYWYWGTHQEAVAKTDKDGNVVGSYIETLQRWPGCKPRVLKRESVVDRK